MNEIIKNARAEAKLESNDNQCLTYAYLTLIGDLRVQTFYDRKSRSWITQLKNKLQLHVGKAEYNGTREGAEFSHCSMVNEQLVS